MGKLQPNFSWQKYEGKEEDQKEQFQYQLQQEHIVVANSVNATISDLSFFTTERQTSFAWVDGKYIFKKSIPLSAWTSAGTINTIPLGIAGNFAVINWICWISNGTLSSSTTLLMPNVDVATAANEISIARNGTNVVLTSGGTDYSSYTGYLTVYYTKN